MRYVKLSVVAVSLCLNAIAISAPLAEAQTPSSQQGTAPAVKPPTATKQWTGDLDILLKKRVIRVGVPYSKTLFYTVKGTPQGLSYETGRAFEQYLNQKYPQQNKNIKIQVLFFVTSRGTATTNLNGGTLDVLLGGIAITPERQKIVDFSNPIFSDSKEVIVTAPDAPQIASVEDLSGKEVFVRKTSAYWEHVEKLNEKLDKEKKPPVMLTALPDDLSDEDILEMVNAGLIPSTVVNDWMAKLWRTLLPKMQIHSDVAVAESVAYGWAVRKNSPQLLAVINDFIKTHGQGSAFSKQLVAKYTGSTYMLKQAVSSESMKRFDQTAQTFRKYSDKYSMDYLLMMAEGYQESALNQQAKSQVGAVGVMQLMPDTGKEMNVGDITQEDANIHAGIKYFNATMKRLYGDEPMDDLNKVLFTFAAYNCGPARVKQLRAEATQKGLDPNVWMNNVEFIAAARVGQETVNYVTNIYKYSVAYKLIAMQEEQRRKAKESLQQKPS
jgi:membrane-bound lytic murein transglycosylase MltF